MRRQHEAKHLRKKYKIYQLNISEHLFQLKLEFIFQKL
jgi:hypothetical protein